MILDGTPVPPAGDAPAFECFECVLLFTVCPDQMAIVSPTQRIDGWERALGLPSQVNLSVVEGIASRDIPGVGLGPDTLPASPGSDNRWQQQL